MIGKGARVGGSEREAAHGRRGTATAESLRDTLDHPRTSYLKDRGKAASSSTIPCLAAGVLSVTKSTTSAAAKQRRGTTSGSTMACVVSFELQSLFVFVISSLFQRTPSLRMSFTCWPVMRIVEETFGEQVDEPFRVVAREGLHIRASAFLQLFLRLQAAAVLVTAGILTAWFKHATN